MKTARILIYLSIVLLGLITLMPQAAMAQPTPPPENVDVNPAYPKMKGSAGSSINYEVQLAYMGPSAKVFDLQVVPPAGWQVYINPQFDTTTKISSIRLDPAFTGLGTKVNVVATVPLFPLPDPGEYQITLTASSGTVRKSATLTAVVTPLYYLRLVSVTEQFRANAQPGKDSVFSINVQNLGTAPINNIGLSSTGPEGWTVSFSPDKVDTLPSFDEKSVDVIIKPDARTVPGDYVISLSAAGTETLLQPVSVRVTVESASIWGWVGVGIIFAVVIGLILTFLRVSGRH